MTEYGVHWNFFLTIAVVLLVGKVLPKLVHMERFGFIGVFLLVIYQMALRFGGLQEYIENDQRQSLLDKNKEGVFSCIGYLAINLLATRMGVGIKKLYNGSEKAKLRNYLLYTSFLCYSLYYMISTSIPASRRLANATYCIWIVALCTGHLGAFLSVECCFHAAGAESVLLDSLNKHQLPAFLLANLLTGAINMTMQIMLMREWQAISILLLYTGCVICGVLFVLK